MKDFRPFLLSVLATTLILGLFFHHSGSYDAAGIMATLKEIKETLIGIRDFINGIATITHFVGFTTIAVLFFLLILSAGLSAIGFPRGIMPFFTALILIDIIWIFWKISLKASFSSYIEGIVRTNAVIITPVLLFFILKKYLPIAFRFISRIVFRNRTLSKSRAMKLINDINTLSGQLQQSLVEDLSADSNEKIHISSATLRKSEDLEDVLSTLKNLTKKK